MVTLYICNLGFLVIMLRTCSHLDILEYAVVFQINVFWPLLFFFLLKGIFFLK